MGLRKAKIPHILIIDDESGFTIRTSMTLRCAGYRVSVTPDAAEALDHLVTEESTPDLILLALAMPGMDGWRFREIQKAHSKLWHIPVVVVTDAPVNKEYTAALEASAMLIKPIERSELLKTLNNVLSYRAGAIPLPHSHELPKRLVASVDS